MRLLAPYAAASRTQQRFSAAPPVRGLIPALRRLPIKRAKRPHLPNPGYYRNHRFAMQFRFLALFTVLARIVI